MKIKDFQEDQSDVLRYRSFFVFGEISLGSQGELKSSKSGKEVQHLPNLGSFSPVRGRKSLLLLN